MNDPKTPMQKTVETLERNQLLKKFAEHFEISRLAHDYLGEWIDAKTAAKKAEIIREYRKEVISALLLPFGVRSGEALALHYLISHFASIVLSYFVLIMIILIIIQKKN